MMRFGNMWKPKKAQKKLEANSFEIQRQALASQHALALRQIQAASKSKIAQLEREVARIRSALDDAHEENERLSVAIESR